MNINSDFNVRAVQLSSLLDIDMENFKLYQKIDFNEGVLKNLKFCILET